MQQIHSLNGLRGIAVLLVLFFHLTPEKEPLMSQGLQSLPLKIANIGWSGVDLFFVLSGFLITRLLLQSDNTAHSLRNFFMRRALRIVPLCYFGIIFCAFILPTISSVYIYTDLNEQIPFWLFFSNFLIEDSLLTPLGHYWSLAIEIQFYLLWPTLYFLFRYKGLQRFLIVLLLITIVGKIIAIDLQAHWRVMYQWSFLRSEALIIGCFIGLYTYKKNLKEIPTKYALMIFLTSGLFVFSILWFEKGSLIFKSDFYKIIYPFIFSVFYGSTLFLCLTSNFFNKVFSIKLFTHFGKYSYGLYVYHFILNSLFLDTFSPSIIRDHFTSIGHAYSVYLFLLLSIFISYIIAITSFHIIERPFLKLKKYFPLNPKRE